METNKEYKRIFLQETHDRERDHLQLNGKVVDKISLSCDNDYEDQCELLITFKDKTYVAFGIDDINDGQSAETVYNIRNASIVAPMSYNQGRLPHWVDADGKLHFMPLVQNRVDLGIWNVEEEDVARALAERKRLIEESEWKQYLHLKEKFKDRIEKE